MHVTSLLRACEELQETQRGLVGGGVSLILFFLSVGFPYLLRLVFFFGWSRQIEGKGPRM